jgi:hypothetical protein
MKTSKLLLVLVFVVALFSCNRKENLNLQTGQENDLYKRILALGFNKGNIVEYKDYYLVDGDMVFKKNLKLNAPLPTLKQAHYPNSSIYIPSTVYVYIDRSSFSYIDSAAITSAAEQAMYYYNQLYTNTFFYRSETYSQCKIYITNGQLSENNCGGWGDYPAAGFNGSTLYLDEDFIVENSEDLVLLIAHQMGHIIGLRHTDWYEQGENEAWQITGTPEYPATDGSSMMNKVTCDKSWGGFSYYDQVAIHSILGSE